MRTTTIAAAVPAVLALRTWQPIRVLRQSTLEPALTTTDSEDLPPGSPEYLRLLYPEHTLRVPIDHFPDDPLYAPHTDDTFGLRYWYDAQHYRPGGPVIVLAAGETSGANRLPFLQKGILAQLAQATHGIGVVLEHRYYGTSLPFGNASLHTDALRFLRTEQALADTAFFARHVDLNVTDAPGPWIVYGGSYAGAFAALARIVYPDVFWGAISSSGVTVAVHDYWEYYEAHRTFGPPACMARIASLIGVVDELLAPGAPDEVQQKVQQKVLGGKSGKVGQALKDVFGLGSVVHDDDFAAAVSQGLDGFQGTNWDPAISDGAFGAFCANVTADELLYPELEVRRPAVQALLGETSHDEAGLDGAMLNWIGWLHATQPCADANKDACFNNHNATFYRQDDIGQRWRAWAYQYCTQWGYLATGSGVPADRAPLVSRLLTVEYLSTVCRAAFNVTDAPDTQSINKYGGFDMAYPRVAFVDGEADPWRAATPHAIGHNADRTSTVDQPFVLIAGGVHHWDENGLFANETTPALPPPEVRAAQAAEAAFVQAWVAEYAGQ